MATGRHQLRNALTILFLLYAALQLYVVAKARSGLALGWPMTAVLVTWMRESGCTNFYGRRKHDVVR